MAPRLSLLAVGCGLVTLVLGGADAKGKYCGIPGSCLGCSKLHTSDLMSSLLTHTATVYPRYPLQRLMNESNLYYQRELFLLAMHAITTTPNINDIYSHYQLGDIHGLPFLTYNKAETGARPWVSLNGAWYGGLCWHFTNPWMHWHRFYMLTYEKVIRLAAVRNANTITKDKSLTLQERRQWRKAAKELFEGWEGQGGKKEGVCMWAALVRILTTLLLHLKPFTHSCNDWRPSFNDIHSNIHVLTGGVGLSGWTGSMLQGKLGTVMTLKGESVRFYKGLHLLRYVCPCVCAVFSMHSHVYKTYLHAPQTDSRNDGPRSHLFHAPFEHRLYLRPVPRLQTGTWPCKTGNLWTGRFWCRPAWTIITSGASLTCRHFTRTFPGARTSTRYFFSSHFFIVMPASFSISWCRCNILILSIPSSLPFIAELPLATSLPPPSPPGPSPSSGRDGACA